LREGRCRKKRPNLGEGVNLGGTGETKGKKRTVEQEEEYETPDGLAVEET